ncbi:MAG: hypothetical protein IRZ13_00445 [Acetobacteraceae bacterium]|nr:hypothetical protein [Acetobacteraceae bacterium]
MTGTDDEAEQLRAATAALQERLRTLEEQSEALAERLVRLPADDIAGHGRLVAEQNVLSQELREILAEGKRIAARQSSLLAVLRGEHGDGRGSA